MPSESFSETALQGLLALGSERRFLEGDYLLREHDRIRGFFWILEGGVRVFQVSFSGREVEVGRFGAGEMVAAALGFSRERFPHFAQALTATRVVFLPRAAAWERIVTDPALAGHFLSTLSGRCQGLQERIELMAFHDVRERFLRYLLQLCPHEGHCRIQLPRAKREIAQMLWTTPETLSRILADLVREGLVEVRGREIRVLSCTRLCGSRNLEA